MRNKEKGLGNKKTFFFPPPDYIFWPKAKEECRVFKGDLIFPSLLRNLVTIEELVLWKVLFFHFRVFGDVSLPFGLWIERQWLFTRFFLPFLIGDFWPNTYTPLMIPFKKEEMSCFPTFSSLPKRFLQAKRELFDRAKSLPLSFSLSLFQNEISLHFLSPLPKRLARLSKGGPPSLPPRPKEKKGEPTHVTQIKRVRLHLGSWQRRGRRRRRRRRKQSGN